MAADRDQDNNCPARSISGYEGCKQMHRMLENAR
jgi:hypothetical protein